MAKYLHHFEGLGDEIPDYMSDIIRKRYDGADKYLSMEIPKHTDKIPNIKVNIDRDDFSGYIKMELKKKLKSNILDEFKVSKMFDVLWNDNILYLLNKSNSDWKIKSTDHVLNLDSIKMLYDKKFRLPVKKDNNFNNPIFSNNMSGIYNFLRVCKSVFGDFVTVPDDLDAVMNDRKFSGLRIPVLNIDSNINRMKNSKLYLYISDKPDDKLRMSISLFYDSCQNMYLSHNNEHNKKLLANVFDTNSKVAYLILDTPFKDNYGNEHPYTPISRMIIRAGKGNAILFDRVYPIQMERYFHNIVMNNTKLIPSTDVIDYEFFQIDDKLPLPYMDKYNLIIKNYKCRIIADSLGVDITDVNRDMDLKDLYKVGDKYYKLMAYDDAFGELIKDFTEVFRNVIRFHLDGRKIYGDFEIVENILKELKLNDLIRIKAIDAKYVEDGNINLIELTKAIGKDILLILDKIDIVPIINNYDVIYLMDNLICNGLGEYKEVDNYLLFRL